MVNLFHVFSDISALKMFLQSSESKLHAAKARSILIQVFSSRIDQGWIESITETVEKELPGAVIVGTTTVGEIANGRLFIGTTVLSFSFFEMSYVKSIAMSCFPGDELTAGQWLSQEINKTWTDIAGVLLLATSLSIDTSRLVQGLAQNDNNYPLFGGGAGDYASVENSLVFCGREFFRYGAVAVVFSGKDLHISSHTYLGWQPLSKEMTITKADGMLVKTVDDIPVFEIYHRYLDIQQANDLFLNALEFPFLLERDGELIARVPLSVGADGAVHFISDLNEGEKIRIGYGDPEKIIHDANAIQKLMFDFDPDAIFLYTCCCRRFLMQNEVDLETQPFQAIAPTVGFYTHAEFHGTGDKIRLLNSTMVVVGMREGKQILRRQPGSFMAIDNFAKSAQLDPFANKHTRIISRLVQFINAVTSDLEQANQELTKLSETDMLTQIYNRLKIDAILKYEFLQIERYHTDLSIILMDVDDFKRVNDTYGHNVGDEVLIRITAILQENIRAADSLGRWGGEEFLLVLPQTNLGQACMVAEKLRSAVDNEIFPIVKQQTCSFGVASFYEGETQDKLLTRADKALYKAKHDGRNKVSCKIIQES